MFMIKKRVMNQMANAGMNQTNLAKSMNIRLQLVNSWICGRRNPKPSTVAKMANILGCKVSDIASFSDDIEMLADKGDKFAQTIIANDEVEEYKDTIAIELRKLQSEIYDKMIASQLQPDAMTISLKIVQKTIDEKIEELYKDENKQNK